MSIKNKDSQYPFIIFMALIGVSIAILIPLLFRSVPWYAGIPIIFLVIGILMIFIGVHQNKHEPLKPQVGVKDSTHSLLWGSILFIIGIIGLIVILFPGSNILIYVFLFFLLAGIAVGLIWLLNNKGFSYD